MKEQIESTFLYKAQLSGGKYEEKVKSLLDKRYTHMPMAYVHSFGCQQNVAEGEKIRGLLYEMGYGFTDKVEDAQLVLYNTCAIRENAHNRVFGNVGALKAQKYANKDMLIVLCGCMMQQQEVVDKINGSYPFVDIVFGTNAIHLFPKMVYDRLKGSNRVFVNQESSLIVEELPVKREGRVKASIPIIQGCNNYCSYCIVPYVRGREVSRTPEWIMKETKEALAEGFKEITLLGQNVNSYGKELGVNFSDLLKSLDKLEGDHWIKFMTSHPKDCTKELIDTIADSKHVCHHIHLPVQCGSNRILNLMNRRYTVEHYLELIQYAKERIPDVTFSTDLIVGFPGETYEDFKETLELVRKVEYAMLYTFIYSKRSGTAAANFPEVATDKDKSSWMGELLAVQGEINVRVNQALIGSTQRVLVESKGKSGDDYIAGRNASGTIVEFLGSTDLIGQFVEVEITKAFRWAIVGTLKTNDGGK